MVSEVSRRRWSKESCGDRSSREDADPDPESREKRQDLGAWLQPATQYVPRLANLRSPGRNFQHVPGPLSQSSSTASATFRVSFRRPPVSRSSDRARQRGTSGRDRDQRRGLSVAILEVQCKTFGVNQAEVMMTLSQAVLAAVAAGNRAGNRCSANARAPVDDDGVVGIFEICRSSGFGQQDAIGHQPMKPSCAPFGEAHLEADGLDLGLAQLPRCGSCHAAGGDATRLRVADQPAPLVPAASAIFGNCVVLPEPVSPVSTTT